MATQPTSNHVMFVCSNPHEVTELLYDYFQGTVPELSGSISTSGLRGNPWGPRLI